MKNNIDGKNIFARLFMVLLPVMAVGICLIAYACIFDTFNLDIITALYNLLLLLPLLGFSLVLLQRFDLAVIFASAVAFSVYYIDAFVYAMRLTHIRLSDFNLLSHALRVSNRYRPIWNSEITRRLLIVIALCGLVVYLMKYFKLKYSKKAVCLTGFVLISIGAFVIFAGLLPHISETFDFTSIAERNGLVYSWYCQYYESKLEAPAGYSKTIADETLSRYVPTHGDTDTNIIVIMNESLTDYSLLGEIPFDDPLPNLHSYRKNSFFGKLAVSVLGGGTSNTEYEFLTGNAMAFLPEGSTPFLQYIVNDENSIARDVTELGYTKIAIHPYYSEEWNRSQVYQFLGFDRFISGVDFGNSVVTNGKKATSFPSNNLISFGDGPLYVRGLISDRSCFQRVLEEYTEHSFSFVVTMQNHGGYEYDGSDFTNTKYCSEKDMLPPESANAKKRTLTLGRFAETGDNETYKVNQYLTCTNLSDTAFKWLTEQLESSNHRTIVLMFGDHQPALRIPELFMQIENFNEAMYYVVPYILWANYDIEFDAPEYTSPNYLSAILKKNAGLPLTAWDQFRLDEMQEYPVVTANFILDRNGNQVSKDVLKDYEFVQYMRMFDR